MPVGLEIRAGLYPATVSESLVEKYRERAQAAASHLLERVENSIISTEEWVGKLGIRAVENWGQTMTGVSDPFGKGLNLQLILSKMAHRMGHDAAQKYFDNLRSAIEDGTYAKNIEKNLDKFQRRIAASIRCTGDPVTGTPGVVTAVVNALDGDKRAYNMPDGMTITGNINFPQGWLNPNMRRQARTSIQGALTRAFVKAIQAKEVGDLFAVLPILQTQASNVLDSLKNPATVSNISLTFHVIAEVLYGVITVNIP